jgi:hypothetical protein
MSKHKTPFHFLFIFSCFLFTSHAYAQAFLPLLKELNSSVRNYQIPPDRIKFIDTRYDQFTLQNFLDLYNHTYDTNFYASAGGGGHERIVEALLRGETSIEFKEYVKISRALTEISGQRRSALYPISEKIFQLERDIEGCERKIIWLREKAEEIVTKEEEAMRKKIRVANTLNAISSFAAGFTGSSENLVYHVPPSSAMVWWYEWDFSDDGNSVPVSMRKKYDNHDVRSQKFISMINDFIKECIEWKNELSAQKAILEQEYDVNERKWDKAKSDYITTTFGFNKSESYFLEKALENKYREWYVSELEQLRATFIRKFGAVSTDILFIKQFTLFANHIKNYYSDMSKYSSYDKDIVIEGISYNDIQLAYEKLKANPNLKNPYFTKAVENMNRFSDYVNTQSEKYYIFKEYAEGKNSDYFYTISRGFIQSSANLPVKAIETVISYIDDLTEPVFEELSEEFSLLFKDFEFESIGISTNYLGDSLNGLKNMKAKKVILYFNGDQLDANEVTVFKRVIGIKQLEIICDCKIKNLKNFQATTSINVVVVEK